MQHAHVLLVVGSGHCSVGGILTFTRAFYLCVLLLTTFYLDYCIYVLVILLLDNAVSHSCVHTEHPFVSRFNRNAHPLVLSGSHHHRPALAGCRFSIGQTPRDARPRHGLARPHAALLEATLGRVGRVSIARHPGASASQ